MYDACNNIKKFTKIEKFKIQLSWSMHKIDQLDQFNNNNNNNNNIIIISISACTGDTPETAFLFQRLSLTIQLFNAVCFN